MWYVMYMYFYIALMYPYYVPLSPRVISLGMPYSTLVYQWYSFRLHPSTRTPSRAHHPHQTICFLAYLGPRHKKEESIDIYTSFHFFILTNNSYNTIYMYKFIRVKKELIFLLNTILKCNKRLQVHMHKYVTEHIFHVPYYPRNESRNLTGTIFPS